MDLLFELGLRCGLVLAIRLELMPCFEFDYPMACKDSFCSTEWTDLGCQKVSWHCTFISVLNYWSSEESIR